jgi:hypothetical protein
MVTAYRDEMENALRVWDAEIARLVARRDQAGAEMRVGYSTLIAVLRSKRERVGAGLLSVGDRQADPPAQHAPPYTDTASADAAISSAGEDKGKSQQRRREQENKV